MANISRTLEMFKMRKEGLSYEEIGKRYGLTRQRVYRIIGRTFRGDLSKIKRVNLREFFHETGMSIRKFTRLVYGSSEDPLYERVLNFMYGKDAHFTIGQIKKMCEITGLTFDELIEVGYD